MKKTTFEKWFDSQPDFVNISFHDSDGVFYSMAKRIWNASEINAGIYVDNDHHVEKYYQDTD
jgi:hypothetical protein